MSDTPKTPSNGSARKDTWKGGLQVRPKDVEPLTEQEIAFTEAYIANGGDAIKAVKEVGIDKGRIKSLLGDPRVREVIEVKRDLEIKTTGATQAWATIQGLMTDPAAPAQVKFQAAKWTLEASGHGLSAVAASLQLGLKKTNKPLSEMSVSELEDFIARGRSTFDTMKATVGTVLKAHANTIDLKASAKVDKPLSDGGT